MSEPLPNYKAPESKPEPCRNCRAQLDKKLKAQLRPNTQDKHYKRKPREVPQRDERDRKFY